MSDSAMNGEMRAHILFLILGIMLGAFLSLLKDYLVGGDKGGKSTAE